MLKSNMKKEAYFSIIIYIIYHSLISCYFTAVLEMKKTIQQSFNDKMQQKCINNSLIFLITRV